MSSFSFSTSRRHGYAIHSVSLGPQLIKRSADRTCPRQSCPEIIEANRARGCAAFFGAQSISPSMMTNRLNSNDSFLLASLRQVSISLDLRNRKNNFGRQTLPLLKRHIQIHLECAALKLPSNCLCGVGHREKAGSTDLNHNSFGPTFTNPCD